LEKVGVFLRHVSKSASPRVEVIAERVFSELYPLTLSVIKLFSFGVQASDGVCVLVNETHLVP